MSGAPAIRPSLVDVRTLLVGALAMGGPWGAILELCIRSLCLPWEAAGIELERIDWDRGFVPVPARGGAMRLLALSHEAQRTILRIAGETRGTGQAVTAGRGPRLQAETFRLDRLLDRLAEAAPETIRVADWNFHGIRATAEAELAAAGAGTSEIHAVIGRQPPNALRRQLRDPKAPTIAIGGGGRNGAVRRLPLRGDAELARTGIERWSLLLLPVRPAPGGRS